MEDGTQPGLLDDLGEPLSHPVVREEALEFGWNLKPWGRFSISVWASMAERLPRFWSR